MLVLCSVIPYLRAVSATVVFVDSRRMVNILSSLYRFLFIRSSLVWKIKRIAGPKLRGYSTVFLDTWSKSDGVSVQ